MKVLILGSGPTALVAAHAALAEDHDLIVVSEGKKSPLYGCQYLHEPVPFLTHVGDALVVNYRLEGAVEDYARKVYGPNFPTNAVSPSRYTGQRPAWSLRAMYNRLWDAFRPYIQEKTLNADNLTDTLDYYAPDLTFSSVPAPTFCRNQKVHGFDAGTVWALGDAPELGQYAPRLTEDEEVVCNGSTSVGWYRASRVFGMATVEWPNHNRPPIEGVARVRKPLRTNCTCLKNYGWDVVPIGRYGKWEKGILVHEAYEEATTALGNRQMELF